MPVSNRHRWFVLDDDNDLVEELMELGREIDSMPIVTQCIDDAIAAAKTHSCEICVAFIDMMLPKSPKDLLTLNDLMRQREGLDTGRPLMDPGSLRAIDDQIRPLIDINGGFTFLKSEAQVAMAEWVIYVFSARTPPANIEEELKCGQALEVKWMQKPVEPDEILDLLKTHIRNR